MDYGRLDSGTVVNLGEYATHKTVADGAEYPVKQVIKSDSRIGENALGVESAVLIVKGDLHIQGGQQ